MISSRIQAIVLSSTVLLTPAFAQTNSTNGSGGNSTAGETTMNRPSTDTSMSSMKGSAKDKKFLLTAAQGGLAEIQMGQLATQKSNNDQVKQMGQQMVTDHTQLNAEMKPFADAMGVPTPASLAPKDQAEATKLSGLSGDAFDKEYVAYMDKDHHKDVREFTAESASTQNQSLKATVDKGLTVIQQHTTMADNLVKTVGAKSGKSNHSTSPAAE